MRPDLAIVDLLLGGMSGLELICRLMSVAGPEHVPIIVASGLTSVFDEKEVLRAGAASNLAKPFNVSELMEAVQHLIPLPGTGALTPATWDTLSSGTDAGRFSQ